MKILSLITVTLITGNLMAKECVDLNGKYQMNLKRDCSQESTESIGVNRYYTSRLYLADYRGSYGGVAYLDQKAEHIEFDINQNGCEELEITYTRNRPNNPKPEITSFKYKIAEGKILKNGFKFKEVAGTFSGNGGGDAGVFGIYREKNKFKIVQDEADQSKIYITSSNKHRGALFFVIPFFESEAFVDCTMEKVE